MTPTPRDKSDQASESSDDTPVGSDRDTRIVWMDLEMTGLDPESDEIIEVATLITDSQLEIVAEGPELVINQPPERFSKMDAWNQSHHSESGLWKKVLESKIDRKEAERLTLEFLKEHIPEGKCPLAGNSIWQDRRFLVRYMKEIDRFLHYRMIDVSSFKEVVQRWYPKPEEFSKKNAHRALDDIKESIEELKFYRKNFFRS